MGIVRNIGTGSPSKQQNFKEIYTKFALEIAFSRVGM